MTSKCVHATNRKGDDGIKQNSVVLIYDTCCCCFCHLEKYFSLDCTMIQEAPTHCQKRNAAIQHGPVLSVLYTPGTFLPLYFFFAPKKIKKSPNATLIKVG